MDKNAKVCHGKDIFERMNYLYQVIMFFNHLYISLDLHERAFFRESDIKRTICKCCQSPLIPGETARVRLVSKPVKAVKYTCLTCLSVKKYPTKKGHKLWTERPESVVQNLNYALVSSEKKPNVKERKGNSNRTERMDTDKKVECTQI
ncbi:ribonuclease P protein subunit rpr2-like [Ceratina calcarata]|uniref:Ribonuclease P protein subunit rpr2-like n=1 Tax=Ceratina calcarata TaxID=156304 RepID=A0AAJ7S8S6_9HYME|nr:ribonuclease P protein subunit rpr2-like [Ceratina calcarata]